MTISENYDGYVKYGPDEAATYDETRTDEALWHFENDFIKEYFCNQHPSRILDAPVGTGRFLHYYPRDSYIVGLDVSEHMLHRAKQRLSELSLPHAELVQGDIFHLDYEANHFDSIVCWRLLHLLPSEMLTPALTELGRVLRGKLVAQIYIKGSHWQRFRSRGRRAIMRLLGRGPKVHPHRTSTHIRSYVHTCQTLESAFAQAGLMVRGSHVLGHYYGHDVCVYVLERRQ
jgi:SAM-dependent methyltransferase